MNALPRRSFLSALLASLPFAACRPPSEGEIGPSLAPAELAARLAEVKEGKIAVLYVGPAALFERGHVPGARDVGEVSTEAGRRALESTLAALPKETEVVLYCGCCPVANCPNVRPASAMIRASGRPNGRVLDLPTRFATDWADKGYPVARGREI